MKTKNYYDKMSELYRYYGEADILTATIQITENCNLNCSYCYQHNKTNKKLTLEQGKSFIDMLLLGSKDLNNYLKLNEKVAVVLEFIGGEPFLEIDLIEKLSDYFIYKMIELEHKWLTNFKIQIGSNGILYFDKKVQNFLQKHKNHLNLSMTLDGNETLHDMCRRDYNNNPTYKIVEKAILHYKNNYNPNIGSKLTLSPENIQYLSEGVINFINLGITEINFNPIFEDVWSINDAKNYYLQLKKIIDYVISNDLTEIVHLNPLSSFYGAKTFFNDKNWCGGNGKMISINPEGNLYPCIRYMESSLGDHQLPYIIGTLNHGLGFNDIEKERINILQKITKTSQSTQECLNCPIENGCSWCSAFNYETFGTPNKRTTFLCSMHKARVLAIKYFCNKKKEKYELLLPKEEALKIIDEIEYDLLIKE